MSRYICPNGHPFPALTEVRCHWCNASVGVTPVADMMSVRDEVRAALDEAQTHSELVRLLMPIAYPHPATFSAHPPPG